MEILDFGKWSIHLNASDSHSKVEIYRDGQKEMAATSGRRLEMDWILDNMILRRHVGAATSWKGAEKRSYYSLS